MARPPLPLGTNGRIRVYRHGDSWRARTLYRDWDGTTRHVEKYARTQAAAERALIESLRDRHRSDAGALITPDTRVDVLAQAWWNEIEQGSHSPGTRRNYRDRLDRQVIPTLGRLRVRELTTGAIDRHLRVVRDKHGAGTAKLTRTVLSGMCGLAARYDALDRNPVREASAITRTTPRTAPQALTAAQATQLRAALTYDEKAIKRDLPDFVSMMLATGLRIGEVCAITWDCIDFDAATIRTGGIVVRVPGKGLQNKTTESSKVTPRLLRLPSWAVEMLRIRASHSVLSHDPLSHDPVFPAPLGNLRDPSNTQADLRDAFAAADFTWVTSHVLRKTVATLMDQAGLSARAAADQLGHAKPSMTSDRYFGRGVTDTGAADVLEALA
ncbi:site-specific integrase [Pseudonocardia sp. DSM 45834]|uniref:Site-specific integrase n=2 Tax=Pseudonocardia charpentierae TaxID=3075545 RepID=A0ABU2NH58_9PSEU|nr:site-specific integrase [Pseudonocardia sp. DSM 45834]